MPVFQKAKIDLELGVGGVGLVRASGRGALAEIRGRGLWGSAEVPGIEGYCIL